MTQPRELGFSRILHAGLQALVPAAAVITLLAGPATRAVAQGASFFHPVPAASAISVEKNVAYMQAAGKDVVMDVYRPAGSAGTRLPVLIFVNTMAARSQRDHGIYTGWASAATAHRLVAILPDAAPEFGAGLDALLAHLRTHADRLGVDPERVAVYAASGNVVSALPKLMEPGLSGVHAAVLYYGAASVTSFRLDLPLLFVRAGLDRPAVNRDLDGLVALALQQNAPVQLLNLSGGHHAFEMLDDNDATRGAIDATLRFVTATLDRRYQSSLRAGIPGARAAGAMASGDFAAAAALYGRMVTARPADNRLRLSYGEALLGAKRYREARSQFDGLKDARLGPRDLGLPAARAALADGDPDNALTWLKTIPRQFLPARIAEDPDFAPLRERADFKALFP
jgi:hypothetical protein